MKISHAIILAAGRGLRMYPLTEVIPKPMVPIDGTTLIAKGIENIVKNIPNLHITVGYKKSMLAKHVTELGVSSIFNTEGQSNSWWIFNTLVKHLNEPIYVLTCDNLVELDFSLLEENYQKLNCPPAMLIPVAPVEGLEGDYIFHENNVVRQIHREKKADIYCSGVQIINPFKINQAVNNVDDFYGVWNSLIAQNLLYVSDVYPKKWFAVDTVVQLEKAQNA